MSRVVAPPGVSRPLRSRTGSLISLVLTCHIPVKLCLFHHVIIALHIEIVRLNCNKCTDSRLYSIWSLSSSIGPKRTVLKPHLLIQKSLSYIPNRHPPYSELCRLSELIASAKSKWKNGVRLSSRGRVVPDSVDARRSVTYPSSRARGEYSLSNLSITEPSVESSPFRCNRSVSRRAKSAGLRLSS